MSNTFIMRGEWLENIVTLPEEMQDKIIADIARYGTRQPTKYDDDPIVFSIVNGYKGRIDASIQEYEDKISMSKSAGRKKKLNEQRVYELAKEGRTAQEIANELGFSKSTIDKSKGWKSYRNNEEFAF